MELKFSGKYWRCTFRLLQLLCNFFKKKAKNLKFSLKTRWNLNFEAFKNLKKKLKKILDWLIVKGLRVSNFAIFWRFNLLACNIESTLQKDRKSHYLHSFHNSSPIQKQILHFKGNSNLEKKNLSNIVKRLEERSRNLDINQI